MPQRAESPVANSVPRKAEDQADSMPRKAEDQVGASPRKEEDPRQRGGNPKANDAEASDREPYGMDKPGGAGSTGFKESDAEDG